MRIQDGIAFSIGLLFEMTMLLTIWHWSAQRRMFLALLGASILILTPVAASIIFQIRVPARACLGFGGMYIFSGLIWRWWKDGIAPERWGVSEVALAVLATIMFSLANTALGQMPLV